MKRAITAAVLLSIGSAAIGLAGEIGFVEDFALAPDRSKVLPQLIPGTEEYYYYHCLHYQNTGQFDKVPELLAPWVKKHGHSALVRQIENRQALLTYQKDPQASLELLRRRLDLRFDHQAERLDDRPSLPTSLDAAKISRETLTKRAFSRYKDTQGFEDSALVWLAKMDLDGIRRRHLLRRLARPDLTNLPQLVHADLDYEHSPGFGRWPIHGQMTRSQLDSLLEIRPALLNDTSFVQAYLTKLAPDEDEDWRYDPKVKQAYLERMWSFVRRLGPVHNSLKAHVLYQRLVLDRSQGVCDKQRFMTYIKLPRRASYVNPRYLERDEHRRWPVDLNAAYKGVTLLPPIRTDEPLVRSYLLHLFVAENDYLKQVFAEAKIVNGIGDMQQWFALLPAGRNKALRERVDIDFDYANKTLFAPDEPVKLALHVKNVSSLIVKVFEINTLNYYRENLRELDTGINLDGLVANHKQVHEYKDPPLRRMPGEFPFPMLGRRGAYVVEFIGNGKSSRALVLKGRLRHVERMGAAGHVLTVLDEADRKVPAARAWLAGHEYAADEDGRINIPYTNKPGPQKIILIHDGFASLDQFHHRSESYSLQAGFHVEREALLKGGKASVVIRPVLCVNGVPASLSLLEDVALVIRSVDHDGIATAKEVGDLKLLEDKETTYEFKVPDRLRRIAFVLKAKVKNISLNKKQDLQAARAFSLNGIDHTEKVEDLHLVRTAGGYFIDLLGKTGEIKPHRPVYLDVKHRDFRQTVDAALQTDGKGRVALGRLDDIDWVRARGPGGASHTWRLPRDDRSYPANLHGRAGQALHVPYMGGAAQPTREEMSLLELRGRTYVKDWFSSLKIKDGFIVLEDLPAGDYELLIKPLGARIVVRLTAGEEREGHVLSGTRHLEVRNAAPLQIVSVVADAAKVTVRLANSSKFARVHVTAARTFPQYPVYPGLAVAFPEPSWREPTKAVSKYVSGRNIGDEYRYILDRKQAARFPGNMLKRPALLLNPWAIRKTEAGTQLVRPGEAWKREGEQAAGAREAPSAAPPAPPSEDDFANLDFLADQAVLLANLAPDENGVVTIDRDKLGPHQHVRIVAVDPVNTVFRDVALQESELKTRDLRLIRGLDPAKHFTEQKQITALAKDGKLVLADITTSKMEAYDDLAGVYRLYITLSKNPTLTEFGFVTNWPKLPPEKKRELYSKYACHELSFFVSRKDPEFFRAVVQPYLRNKKDKTFMDHYLLGDDLSGYLQPWAYSQLNIVERILLGRQVAAERANIHRAVKDRFNLIPPDIDRFNHLFYTALKGRALETADALGLVAAAEEAKKLQPSGRLTQLAARGGTAGELRRAAPATGYLARRLDTGKPSDMPARARAPEAQGRAKAAGVVLADRDELMEKDKAGRKLVQEFYRKLDKTQEWVENNYYHLPIEQQNADLITVNAFWNDFAAHADGPFVSKNLAEASHSFAEMMLALAVLDLPFEAAKHDTAHQQGAFTLTAGSAAVVYHREIKQAEPDPDKTPILVSQNFYRHGERYIQVGNERKDKFVTDEFLAGVAYGCHVVVTNPTSSRQKLEVLLQVPVGAIPVLNGQYTRSARIDLEPYRTQTFDYFFYFPATGEYDHYPLHVAKDEKLVASAKPVKLKVVAKLSKIDKDSWDYVSQHGTAEQVLAHMKANNLNRVKLARIAWRMRDRDFFETVIALLQGRKMYDHTLWSYGIRHNVVPAIREYLQHCNSFVSECGDYIDSALLRIDPVIRKTYQHMEYAPLVNARAHQLGKRRRIVNERLSGQYHSLMKVLCYRPKLDDDDLMAVTYYMLLQDRVEEGLKFFGRVNAEKLATRLQHDYFAAYIDFFSDKPAKARQIAAKYSDYPVDRWRKRFVAVLSQLDQIEGKAPAVIDTEDRTERQTELAAKSPSLELKVENRKITVDYKNLTECRVNYYLMDVELLFSRNPFVQKQTGQFSLIRPNATAVVKLPADKAAHTFDLPAKFHNSNVLVEVLGGGIKRSQAYYANSVSLELVENYGQVRVTDAAGGKPLPKVYVKVYARMADGSTMFYKDGYTDLRGRFDYTSLNTNELDHVAKFSMLILSETHGAVVREANPPKR